MNIVNLEDSRIISLIISLRINEDPHNQTRWFWNYNRDQNIQTKGFISIGTLNSKDTQTKWFIYLITFLASSDRTLWDSACPINVCIWNLICCVRNICCILSWTTIQCLFFTISRYYCIFPDIFTCSYLYVYEYTVRA